MFNLQGVMSSGVLNEFKFGYNAAPTTIVGDAPLVNGVDFGLIALNITGSVANTGIAGQGISSPASQCPAAWCAPTAPPTAAPPLTTRTP